MQGFGFVSSPEFFSLFIAPPDDAKPSQYLGVGNLFCKVLDRRDPAVKVVLDPKSGPRAFFKSLFR